MIPYGRQTIFNEDIEAVIKVLRSDWLTTGPQVEEFEKTVANRVNAKYAVATSSGTAALHAAMYALGISPGDEVIVSPISFAATANAVVYQGGVPVFADVLSDNLLIDPACIERKITSNTRAVIAVDYAGHPCDYDEIRKICERFNLAFVADSCHALGAEYKGGRIGGLVDMTVFSFHPVKHITTGEGGMITTNQKRFSDRMKIFRNHGMSTDTHGREKAGTWYYEIVDLGYNYRISDIQCALGISQIERLPFFLEQRKKIAAIYDDELKAFAAIQPLTVSNDVAHAYHLYVVKLSADGPGMDRQDCFNFLRRRNIGVNVHYIPIHLHPFYRSRFNTAPGDCPVAEKAYEQILSLPLYPGLSPTDICDIVSSIKDFCLNS